MCPSVFSCGWEIELSAFSFCVLGSLAERERVNCDCHSPHSPPVSREKERRHYSFGELMSYLDTPPTGFCMFEGRCPAGGATVWPPKLGRGACLNSSRPLARVMSTVLCASPEANDHVCVFHLCLSPAPHPLHLCM